MIVLIALACGEAPPVAHSSLAPAAGSLALAPIPQADALLAGIEFGSVDPSEIRVEFEVGSDAAERVEGVADAGVVEAAFDLVGELGQRFKPEPVKALSKRINDAPASSGVDAPETSLTDVQVAVVAPEGPPPVDPGLSVDQVVRRYSAQTQYCHHAARERWSQVAGRVEIAWNIVDGQVQDVEIVGDTTGDAQMAGCVARKVSNWRFPSNMNTPVTHPFVFDAAEFE